MMPSGAAGSMPWPASWRRYDRRRCRPPGWVGFLVGAGFLVGVAVGVGVAVVVAVVVAAGVAVGVAVITK